MGSSVWDAIGVAEAKLGEWLAEAKTAVTGLTGKVTTLFAAEEKLAPEVVTGVQTVFADLEALIPLAETATTGQGVNWPADSAAYAAYLKLVADVKKLAPDVEAGIAAIKTV